MLLLQLIEGRQDRPGMVSLMKFLFTSGIHVPMNQEFMNFTNGILTAPSGVNIRDVETRSIAGENTVLSGEMIYLPNSGVLMLASGANWVGVQL